jgi:hypothetical protein
MASTGKAFVEWPSLLVVKTEGFREERHQPWFLPATLLANVAVFIGVCCANDCPGTVSFESHDLSRLHRCGVFVVLTH